MNLTTRITGERDWEECAALLQDGFLYTPSESACLPPFWRQMQECGRLNSALLEDLDRPPGRRIVQFGVSVWVSDEFMQAAKAEEEPGLSRRVMERVWQGQSPLLDAAAIRRANSGGGLNLLVLHFGMTLAGLDEAQVPYVLTKLPENFLWLHAGYRIKEILVEHFEDFLVLFTVEAGFRLRASYEGSSAPGLPPQCCPCLVGFTREEALALPGAYVSRVFPYTPPRLFFRPGEQQLLQRAVREETDGEIAAALQVAPATVKTRWRTIYERVAECAPDLLPAASDSGRGLEKRRLLLRYLRDHPEELRPVLPPDTV